MEGIVIGEYKALIEEFKNKQYNDELIENFIKVSKLFEVLTVFNVDEKIKENYLAIGKNAAKYAVKIKKELKEMNKPVPVPID